MRPIQNIQILLLVVASVLPQLSKAFNAGDFGDFNLIFINGINKSDVQARALADDTAEFLMQPGFKVVDFLNRSAGPLFDLLETYRLSQIDGASNNTTNFWKWVGSPVLAPIAFQDIYYSVTSLHTNPLSSAFSDLSTMKSRIDGLQATKKKTIIFSHSEGNFFSNQLVDLITQSNPDMGQNCTGIVAVATPATRVANSDPWVTNTKDVVINTARQLYPFGGSILPANSVGLFSSLDESGHGYVDTYLTQFNTRTDIAKSVDTVLARINQNCTTDSSCGQPLSSPAGGQGNNQRYTYDVQSSVAQQIEVTFEAYYIPDRLRVIGNGQELIDTGEPISGFHQYPIDYDPAIHGSTLEIIVDAPFDGTQWRFCANCASGGASCSLISNREKVNYSIDKGDYACSIGGVYFDGQRDGSSPVTLSRGTHQFRWEGTCVCDGLFTTFCPTGPTVSINGNRSPLPGASQNYSLTFEVK